jgi:hypothetical protein
LHGKNDNHTIYLKQDIKTCEAVVVESEGRTRCIRCGMRGICIRNKCFSEAKLPAPGVLYPNPAVRSQSIFIEPNNKTSMVRIASNDGKILLSEKISEGNKNRFSIQLPSAWSTGVYYVQLLDDKSKQIETRKLIIQ